MSLNRFPLDLVIQTPGHLPGIIWGGAGEGKTSYINNLFRFLDAPLVTIIGAIREPGDFGGIPWPREDGMRLMAPRWAHEINHAVKGKPLGGVFFSEMTCSPPAIQAAMLRVIHEGWVGEEKLSDKVVRVADANPPDEAANGWELALPLANRLTHLEWPGSDIHEWTDGFLDGWASQRFTRVDRERWDAEYPRARAYVAAFLRSPKGCLREDMRRPENQSRFPQAFATPRTVENAARLLATVFATGRHDAMIALMSGSCGRPWGLAFSTWLEEAKLPDPEELLEHPDAWEADPMRQDVTYAVLSSLADAALREHPAKEKRWITAWTLLGKTAQKCSKGTVAVAARALADKQRCPRITKIPAEVVQVMNLLHEVIKHSGLYDGAR